MAPYILAIDEGSSGVRAHVFDHAGKKVGSSYQEIARNHPRPGWSEHDPLTLVQATLGVIKAALSQAAIRPSDLTALGIATQRASCLVWERSTGRPLYPVIGWQDLRTTRICEDLNRRGVMANPMSSATKIKWILNQAGNLEGRRDDLCFGTLDSWLAWNLTGGVHVTDHSNASCTGLYDFLSNSWDENLLDMIGLPQQGLARVVETSEIVGNTSCEIIGAAIPVAALAGDQQAAMFGQLCLQPGDVKASYGTSTMVDVNIGQTFLLSPHGAYPLVLWKLGGKVSYCLEGTTVTAGASLQWLRDNLRIADSVAEVESLAASVSDSGGVWCVPAFQGLGTPYLNPNARAKIGGLSLATTRAHVARAIFEAIAFRCRQVVQALKKDAPEGKLSYLRVDGGAARSDLLMQLQADLLGVPVERPAVIDAGSLGVAYLAGLAAGVWTSHEELSSLWKREHIFEPSIGEAEREERYHAWLENVEADREPAAP